MDPSRRSIKINNWSVDNFKTCHLNEFYTWARDEVRYIGQRLPFLIAVNWP